VLEPLGGRKAPEPVRDDHALDDAHEARVAAGRTRASATPSQPLRPATRAGSDLGRLGVEGEAVVPPLGLA